MQCAASQLIVRSPPHQRCGLCHPHASLYVCWRLLQSSATRTPHVHCVLPPPLPRAPNRPRGLRPHRSHFVHTSLHASTDGDGAVESAAVHRSCHRRLRRGALARIAKHAVPPSRPPLTTNRADACRLPREASSPDPGESASLLNRWSVSDRPARRSIAVCMMMASSPRAHTEAAIQMAPHSPSPRAR